MSRGFLNFQLERESIKQNKKKMLILLSTNLETRKYFIYFILILILNRIFS